MYTVAGTSLVIYWIRRVTALDGVKDDIFLNMIKFILEPIFI